MRVPNIELKDLPHIITLCGSTKFKEEFESAAKELNLKGSIIFTVSFFTHADNVKITEKQKTMLDMLHLRKISISDEIFVINKDGYIGHSTTNEIAFATVRGIPVIYLEPHEMDDEGGDKQ